MPSSEEDRGTEVLLMKLVNLWMEDTNASYPSDSRVVRFCALRYGINTILSPQPAATSEIRNEGLSRCHRDVSGVSQEGWEGVGVP